MKAPTPPPLPDELTTVLKRMRLPYVRAAAPEVLATAKAQRWDPAEVLRVLLTEEIRGRDAATQRARRRAAGFPTGKTFSSWREDDSSILVPTQAALRTLEWVGRAENLAVAGPSGTGKSHFVEALAHAVIEAGMRVSWFTLESLAITVNRAKIDATIPRVVARICRSELIVVDDSPSAWTPPKPSTESSTPPTNDAPSPSPPTSTPAASTPSCPRRSPPPPSTGCCTTPTSSSPTAPRSGSLTPSPARGSRPWANPPRDHLSAHRDFSCPPARTSGVRPPGEAAVR